METRKIKIPTFEKEIELKFNSLFKEENLDKVKDLVRKIDYFYQYIDDGSQWRAAKQRNRVIAEELLELGCVTIYYPFENRMCTINTETYCN